MTKPGTFRIIESELPLHGSREISTAWDAAAKLVSSLSAQCELVVLAEKAGSTNVFSARVKETVKMLESVGVELPVKTLAQLKKAVAKARKTTGELAQSEGRNTAGKSVSTSGMSRRVANKITAKNTVKRTVKKQSRGKRQ